MDADADRLRPNNLKWLVVVLGGSLGIAFAAVGFELLVEEIAILMGHVVDLAMVLIAAALSGGLVAAFLLNLAELWNGRRRGFRRSGAILVAAVVGDLAIICGGGAAHFGPVANLGIGISILLNLFAARLMTLPDIGAYIAYRSGDSSDE